MRQEINDLVTVKNNNKVQRLIFLGCVITLLVAPLPIAQFKHLDEVQFVILPLLTIACLVWLKVQNKLNLSFGTIDCFWFIFISMHFASYFWARDSSLTITPGFTYLTLYVVFKIGENTALLKDTIKIIKSFYPALFFTFFLLGIYFIFSSNKIDIREFMSLVGFHKNYYSLFLVSLLPFIMIFKKEKYRDWIFISLFFLILLVWFQRVSTTGSLLVLMLLSLYFPYELSKKKRSVNWNVILIVATLGLLLCLGTIIFFFPQVEKILLHDFIKSNRFDRVFLVRNSLWLFLENPLLGVGSGNFTIEAYKYGMDDFVQLNNAMAFKRFEAHNYFGKIIAELGILGIVSFVGIIAIPLKNGIKKFHQLESFYKACFFYIVIYVIGSNLYQSPNFGERYFSGIQLMAFFNLGLISGVTKEGREIKQNFLTSSTAVLIFLAAISTVWFVSGPIYNQSMNAIYTKYSQDAQGIVDNLKVMQKKYGGRKYNFYDLDLLIANQYARLDNDSLEIFHLDKALKKDPYNIKMLTDISHLLLSNYKVKESEVYVLRAFDLKPDQYDVRINMAHYLVLNGKLNQLDEILKIEQDIIDINERMRSRERKSNSKKIPQNLYKFKNQISEVKNLKKLDEYMQYLKENKNFDQAMKILLYANEQDKSNAMVLILMSELECERGNETQSESYLNKALNLSPSVNSKELEIKKILSNIQTENITCLRAKYRSN